MHPSSDGVAARARPPVPGFEWPRRDFPVCLVPTSGPRAREEGDGGTSKSNPAEAEIIGNILRAVLRGDGSNGHQHHQQQYHQQQYHHASSSSSSSYRGSGDAPLTPEQIGVVTPYAAQVRLLRRARPHQAIEVASVDGFQVGAVRPFTSSQLLLFTTSALGGGCAWCSHCTFVRCTFIRGKRACVGGSLFHGPSPLNGLFVVSLSPLLHLLNLLATFALL